MTYTQNDRADLAGIGSSVTAVMADIAHHEMGDITEGWSVYDDMPAEITRLRERLEQLADAATAGLADVRRLEVRAKVRAAWAGAFAAGRVRDYETDPGETDQLNVSGVVDALITAETDVTDRPAPDMTRTEQIRSHLDIRALADQIFDRILDHEDGPENDSALEDEQIRRAAVVVDAFISAVYGPEELRKTAVS